MKLKNFIYMLFFIFSFFSNANEKINKVKDYVLENTDNNEIGNELYGYIKFYAKEYGVEEELIVSVIKIESNFDIVAVSPKGAIGLMQLMPTTAEYLGVEAEYIQDNIKGGTKYLKECLDKNGNDIALALASYNAGLGTVKKYSSIPPYKETHKYIEKILNEYNKLKDTKYIHSPVPFKEDREINFMNQEIEKEEF